LSVRNQVLKKQEDLHNSQKDNCQIIQIILQKELPLWRFFFCLEIAEILHYIILDIKMYDTQGGIMREKHNLKFYKNKLKPQYLQFCFLIRDQQVVPMPVHRNLTVGDLIVQTTFDGNNTLFKAFEIAFIDIQGPRLQLVDSEIEVCYHDRIVSVQSVINRKVQNFLDKFYCREIEELALNNLYGQGGFIPSVCVGNANAVVYKQGEVLTPFMDVKKLGKANQLYVDKLSIIALQQKNGILYRIVESVSEKNKTAIIKNINDEEIPDPVTYQIRNALNAQKFFMRIKKAS
tara:strand:- start:2754 stop:3623 length:870 start_codon:yes stop_codon:yes gene_type:complete